MPGVFFGQTLALEHMAEVGIAIGAEDFHPAAVSVPLAATLVDVTGLVIYFSDAMVILRGTLH